MQIKAKLGHENLLEDGEMSEMTLPSRRNLNPGGLRPSTLPHDQGGSPQY